MKEEFENVTVSHRGFWHRPSNLQTNRTERLKEVKLAVNVRPPYTQTSNNFYSLHVSCRQSYQMSVSRRCESSISISTAMEHLTVTVKSNTPPPHTDRRHHSLRLLEFFVLTWHFDSSANNNGHERRRTRIYRKLHKEQWGLQNSIKQRQFSEHERKKKPHSSVK